jgi:hypothetical protein
MIPIESDYRNRLLYEDRLREAEQRRFVVNHQEADGFGRLVLGRRAVTLWPEAGLLRHAKLQHVAD